MFSHSHIFHSCPPHTHTDRNLCRWPIAHSAPNDMNSFVLQLLNGPPAKAIHRERQLRGATAPEMEALVRLLLSRFSSAGLIYVSTAWFVDSKGRSLPRYPFGAADLHIPIWQHYGLPTTDMPRVLAATAAVSMARSAADTRGEVPYFAHNEWWIDPVRCSFQAHTLQAWMLGRTLELECLASAAALHLGSGKHRHRKRLPQPLHAGLPSDGGPLTLFDFTDRSGALLPLLNASQNVQGWCAALRWARPRWVNRPPVPTLPEPCLCRAEECPAHSLVQTVAQALGRLEEADGRWRHSL